MSPDDPRIVIHTFVIQPTVPKEVLTERQAVDRFAAALAADDADTLNPTCEFIRSRAAWREVFKASAGGPATRTAFLHIWIEHSHRLRRVVGNDTLLLAALPGLLPPYTGPGLKLYRGERLSWHTRKRHGLNWTVDRGVAEMFASGLCTLYPGGGALLEADVPPSAIITGPSDYSYTAKREQAFVVNPRLVGPIRELATYPEDPRVSKS